MLTILFSFLSSTHPPFDIQISTKEAAADSEVTEWEQEIMRRGARSSAPHSKTSGVKAAAPQPYTATSQKLDYR
jgi:hypothetical protein